MHFPFLVVQSQQFYGSNYSVLRPDSSLLLRFGKKKEEKKEAKSSVQRQKSDILSDHELERMRDERER